MTDKKIDKYVDRQIVRQVDGQMNIDREQKDNWIDETKCI